MGREERSKGEEYEEEYRILRIILGVIWKPTSLEVSSDIYKYPKNIQSD